MNPGRLPSRAPSRKHAPAAAWARRLRSPGTSTDQSAAHAALTQENTTKGVRIRPELPSNTPASRERAARPRPASSHFHHRYSPEKKAALAGASANSDWPVAKAGVESANASATIDAAISP